jgi:hypothetical protein
VLPEGKGITEPASRPRFKGREVDCRFCLPSLLSSTATPAEGEWLQSTQRCAGRRPRKYAHCAHVVQAVGELDDDDQRLSHHGQNQQLQLALVLLGRLGVLQQQEGDEARMNVTVSTSSRRRGQHEGREQQEEGSARGARVAGGGISRRKGGKCPARLSGGGGKGSSKGSSKAGAWPAGLPAQQAAHPRTKEPSPAGPPRHTPLPQLTVQQSRAAGRCEEWDWTG